MAYDASWTNIAGAVNVREVYMAYPSFPRQSKFCEYLIEHNKLSAQGFEEWIFYPGMLFQSPDKWWGNGGYRDRPHEGIDVCLYRDQDGKICRLDALTKVPVMYRGSIVSIIDDYTGKTAFVCHDIRDEEGNQLYSIYGHMEPLDSIAMGGMVDEGRIIGSIADNMKNKEIKMLPHLHLSLAWIPEDFPQEKLRWNTISDSPGVTLLNPLDVVGCPYTVLE